MLRRCRPHLDYHLLILLLHHHRVLVHTTEMSRATRAKGSNQYETSQQWTMARQHHQKRRSTTYTAHLVMRSLLPSWRARLLWRRTPRHLSSRNTKHHRAHTAIAAPAAAHKVAATMPANDEAPQTQHRRHRASIASLPLASQHKKLQAYAHTFRPTSLSHIPPTPCPRPPRCASSRTVGWIAQPQILHHP